MPRSKINLEKIRASLATTCPHCGARIEPDELKRVDWDAWSVQGAAAPSYQRQKATIGPCDRAKHQLELKNANCSKPQTGHHH